MELHNQEVGEMVGRKVTERRQGGRGLPWEWMDRECEDLEYRLNENWASRREDEIS